ncbi:MAG: hypothetical protein AAGA62_01425 [Bacteroidota bacterium]
MSLGGERVGVGKDIGNLLLRNHLKLLLERQAASGVAAAILGLDIDFVDAVFGECRPEK